MWPGFSSFIGENVTSKDQLSYLNFILHTENTAFLNASDKNQVSLTISQWVESPITRYVGLVLWHVALEKADLYLNNWGRVLHASLELSASCSTRKISLKILNQMILKFGNMDEYKPSFQRFMPGLMPVLLSNLEDNEGFVLTCESLVVCIKYLPDILASFTPNIEEFLVKHLDNESIEVVEALADCFAIFPKCILQYLYPRNLISVAWVDLYQKAVNTLHTIFEDILLYETGSNGPRVENHRTPTFAVPCNVEGELSYLCHKVRVFSSLSRCLSKLICSESYKVKVYVEELLELITKVISFPEETARQAKDNSVLHLIYPKMCHVAFMLFEAIILNFSVVEHTESILEVALKAMDNTQLVSQTPGYHSKVQLSTWKFLNIWMKQCGSAVSSKIVSGKIIDKLLNDIAVADPENAESELRKETCLEALKVLNMLITSGSPFFEKQKTEEIVRDVLKIVRLVQLRSHPLSKHQIIPYSDENVRVELYNLLHAMCLNDIPNKNSWLMKSIGIFKLGLRDPNIKIVNVCQKASELFVYMVNPKKPPPEISLPIIEEAPRAEEPDDLILAHWEDSQEGNWQHEQLNGRAANVNILPNAEVYQREGVAQEAVMDSENSQERPAELDSPPHYVELGPSNHSNHYNNARTMSRDSSLSEDLPETDSDESVSEEVENDRVPNKHNRASIDIPSAQNTTRPNIQTLEACSTVNEDSSDANVCVVQDVQSDPNSMEEDLTPMPSPKRAVAENGDKEEYYDDDDEEEDEDVEEEEDAEVFPEERLSADEERMSPEREELLSPEPEERLSPEPEERPLKKQKLNDADLSAEMGSGEECEKEVPPEVNGQQGDSEKSLQKENPPTFEEMVSDFVLEEAVDDS